MKWHSVKYQLLSILFWIVVDFTTTQAVIDPWRYYSQYMPALLVFYIGSPIAFSLLIYKFKLSNKMLFFAVIIEIIILEILLIHNTLLYTFPTMVLAIPASISIYSLLCFVPKWIIDDEVKKNRKLIFILTIVYILLSIATILGTR